MRYQNVEGGFWGIIADDGAKYDVVNLPVDFQVDGMRVAFRAKPAKNNVSFHMWGTMIEVTSIQQLGAHGTP